MTELELYYNKFNEEKRLDSRHGQVEFVTSMKYIHKYLHLMEMKKPKQEMSSSCILEVIQQQREIKKRQRNFSAFVRLIGLEPTRRKTPDPKSGASTNFATGALCGCKDTLFYWN